MEDLEKRIKSIVEIETKKLIDEMKTLKDENILLKDKINRIQSTLRSNGLYSFSNNTGPR